MTPAERVYNKIKAHFEAKSHLTVIGINKLLDGLNKGNSVLRPSALINHSHSKEEAITILADFMSAGYTNPRYPNYVLYYAIADCENMLASAYQPTSADKSRVISNIEIYEYLESLKQYLTVVNADGGGTATNYYRQKPVEDTTITEDGFTLAGGSDVPLTITMVSPVPPPYQRLSLYVTVKADSASEDSI